MCTCVRIFIPLMISIISTIEISTVSLFCLIEQFFWIVSSAELTRVFSAAQSFQIRWCFNHSSLFFKTLLRGSFETHGKIYLNFRETSSTSFPVCLFIFFSLKRCKIIHSMEQDISFLCKGLQRTWDPLFMICEKFITKQLRNHSELEWLQQLLVELQFSQSIWIVEDWGLCELFLSSRPAML